MTKRVEVSRVSAKRARGLVAACLALSAFALGWLVLPQPVRGLFEPRARAAAVFTVDSTIDAGDTGVGDGVCDGHPSPASVICTLRAAIQEANATAAADTINFNIPGPGVKTINIASDLPIISKPLSIDGYTQPGAQPNTLADGVNAVLLIELRGSAGANFGLSITSPECAVQGLVINGFTSGIVVSHTAGPNLIAGNFIGTDPTGSVAAGNSGRGVNIINASGTRVGATHPATRNVISGNGVGVAIVTSDELFNEVQGNFIGTKANGVQPLKNAQGGVYVAGGGAVIGGNVAGARNVISGNDVAGVIIENADNNAVVGNFIGTAADGNGAVPNAEGVRIINGSHNGVGNTGGGRNVISGNTGRGISVAGESTDTRIRNNYVGLRAGGAEALPNGGDGIHVAAAPGNFIGGGTPSLANVVSGNAGAGISLGSGAVVLRNLIGTNAAGTAAVGNRVGVAVYGNDNTIGLSASAVDNLISGNVEAGISLREAAAKNFIGGNYIGTDITGANPLGNQTGIEVAESNVDENTIRFNLVAFNSKGVSVHTGGQRNEIRFNSVHSNALLGIDLGADGPTPNDAGDADTGANTLQNFPALASATTTGGATLIQGTLSSKPQQTFRVDFYSNPSCGASGHKFLDTEEVSTDAAGNVTVLGAVPSASLSGPFITATATDASGNTSEFSPCVETVNAEPTPGGATVQFGAAVYSVFEDCTEVIVSVSRTGDTSAEASVEYATHSGTASDRSDFTTALGTLRFAPGETARSFHLLVHEDSKTEGTETATVTLSNPVGADLGAQAVATLEILDDPPEPAGNPNDVAEAFVCQHYHDFLGRMPDVDGLTFWTNEIEACGADSACVENRRVNVSAAFFLSIEFQETGSFVIRTQRAAFGKRSESAASRLTYTQFVRDARQVGEGLVVGQPGWEQELAENRRGYALRLVQGAQFVAQYPLALDAGQYVDALFASAGVSPSAAERQAAVAAFGGGGAEGRAAALTAVADSETLRAAEFRPAFVLMQYFGYLRRNPSDAPDADDSGYQFWLSKLNQFGGDFQKAEMVKAFISSAEYRSRFGQP